MYRARVIDAFLVPIVFDDSPPSGNFTFSLSLSLFVLVEYIFSQQSTYVWYIYTRVYVYRCRHKLFTSTGPNIKTPIAERCMTNTCTTISVHALAYSVPREFTFNGNENKETILFFLLY